MEQVKEFCTSDLYIAAAIWMESHIPPDEFILIQDGTPLIVCKWKETDAVLPFIERMKAGTLLVDPKKFRKFHVDLKQKVLEIKGKKYESNRPAGSSTKEKTA